MTLTLIGHFLTNKPSEKVTATPEMKALVERIGTQFEFHRGGDKPEKVVAASAALDRL